ncbi:MAG: hypothetical protein SGBAC_011069 [Bacillariaceae sp.]
MPKSPKRVTSFFPGKKGLAEAIKPPPRDSSSTDSISDFPIEEGEHAPELSSLLTATEDCNLPGVVLSSSRSPAPLKGILKSTSSITVSSGGGGGSSSGMYFSSGHQIRESRLSFSSIRVREYPVLIGDNPSVGQGVPLTIGWEAEKEETYPLEDFESNHKAEPVSTLTEMKFTPEQRAQIAKSLGYSDHKINKIAHQVKFSTLTTKKKIIRTLHLDTMKTSFRKGMSVVSDSSRKIIIGKNQQDGDHEEEEENDDDGDDREMAF